MTARKFSICLFSRLVLVSEDHVSPPAFNVTAVTIIVRTIPSSNKVASEYNRHYSTGNPISDKNIHDIVDRPLCNCGMPSEVKLSNNKRLIYFVCALKNVWSDFYRYIEVNNPCDFYSVYSDDKVLRTKWDIAKRKAGEQWCSNIPPTTSHYPDPCIKCNTTDYSPIYTWYRNRRICQNCILNKYDELKKEYSFSKYSIVD